MLNFKWGVKLFEAKSTLAIRDSSKVALSKEEGVM